MSDLKSEMIKGVGSDNPFAALGTAIAGSFSIEPGVIMWLLMILSIAGLTIQIMDKRVVGVSNVNSAFTESLESLNKKFKKQNLIAVIGVSVVIVAVFIFNSYQSETTNEYFKIGKNDLEMGQYQKAIENFNEVIRLNPQDAKAYINRGYAYSSLGNYQLAINDLSKAIELNPDARAYGMRGLTYGRLGYYSPACRDVKKSCQLGDCKPLEILRGLAYCP